MDEIHNVIKEILSVNSRPSYHVDGLEEECERILRIEEAGDHKTAEVLCKALPLQHIIDMDSCRTYCRRCRAEIFGAGTYCSRCGQKIDTRGEQMYKISVFIKRPGCNPYRTNISNTLEDLQKLVGGYIETFTFADDACIICNEEGKLLGLEPNCHLFGEDFVGDIIFVGTDGEKFTDFPADGKRFKEIFKNLYKEQKR